MTKHRKADRSPNELDPSPAFAPLPDAEYLPRHPVAERVARGKAARRETPLDRHARWQPSSHRTDPVTILERQDADRDPELVPIRHGRMSASPFAFYRGGAAIMASDLAGTPVAGMSAQLCGDAHLLNFGMFETPERSLVFGLNDFDETLRGPFEWDVKRLAASVEVAGRDLRLGPSDREGAVQATVRAYRAAMLEFASMRNLEVWNARLPAKRFRRDLEKSAGRADGRAVRKKIRKALTRDHIHAFGRFIDAVDGDIRFASHAPLLVPIEELLDHEQRQRYVEVIRDFLHQYRQSLPPDRRLLLESYRFMHMARKVVGVGSVGTRAWAVLMMGRDSSDPLLLQLKEAQPSVLEPYVGRPVSYESNGQRVVEGQRLMQSASDPMLGWYRLRALDDRMHDFYVRQLWDGKASIEVADLDPPGFTAYGESCGWTLARAHARSGERIAIAAYLGEKDGFDRSIAEYASTYADVNDADCERFQDAIADGRLAAITGI